MSIVDGKKIAAAMLIRLRHERARIGIKPRLAAVLVGGDAGSIHFLRQKEKACREIGIGFLLRKFPAGVSREKLKNEIRKAVRDPAVSGMIVQLPLPKRLGGPEEILNLIPARKDPDVLGAEAWGLFAAGLGILPPIVAGIRYILEKYRVSIRGKNVVVVGAGRLVGKPAAIWFMNQGATVTAANEWTRDIAKYTRAADILVSGVGKPGLIRANMVKEDVAVFDAGYSVKNGKAYGDADFRGVSRKASLITPVPGGMGPLGVAMLLKNLIALATHKNF